MAVTLKSILHRIRQIDAWLVPPVIVLVVYGELAQGWAVQVLSFNIWDKILHFTAYLGLCLMTTIAVRAGRQAWWRALGLILMGGTLEIVQGLTGRDAEISDEVANTLGVICGLGIGWAGVAVLRALNLVDAAHRE